ncbi:transglutaminase-like domain-containing protein [Christensenella intestinihominis]|uniref:transglutaminase-like domain-containing protein n=1 Tax=Christensenella intestinihominis TaxID=1851429 RepID=UPI00082BC414|nr:transglutaminase-like domain-containing protein [Christensenella intestinihominis]
MKRRHIHIKSIAAAVLMIAVVVFSACSGAPGAHASGSQTAEEAASAGQPQQDTRSSEPSVLVPEAPGTQVIGADSAVIDISNVSRGYVCAMYTGDGEKVKFQISCGEATYNYDLCAGRQEAFPLNCGDGSYKFSILRNTEGDQYVAVCAGTADVALENEFLPYLYPSQYVDFTPESAAVAQGESLAQGAADDLDVVARVYDYVIDNIAYDGGKANAVANETGYLPDIDETLHTKKGICFDYASLMTAMLRSQRIPTRLVVGYVTTGGEEIYHAWISVYTEGTGWIDNIIYFDGTDWVRMDPTLVASSGQKENYTGEGDQYNAMYYY